MSTVVELGILSESEAPDMVIPLQVTEEQARPILQALVACRCRYSTATIDKAIQGDKVDWQLFAENSARNDRSYCALSKTVEQVGDLEQWVEIIKQALAWASDHDWRCDQVRVLVGS